MDEVVNQSRTMHRTMRDLIALSALPAVWAGYQPRQVAEGLADALLSTLGLDLIYVRVSRGTAGQEIEVSRSGATGGASTWNETRRIAEALKPLLNGGMADPAPSIPNPAGGGMLHLVSFRIGEDGVLVAGSGQTDFPSEADRLLLTVAANQAAAVLQGRRVEQALRESEERFRFLVQNSSDIISLFDAEGTILYQAPSVERLLGHRPRDRIGHNVFRDRLVHPDDLGAKRAFFDAILSRPGAPVTAEFRLRCADGSWRDIEAIGQNFLHDPSVAGIVTNYRDITERKLLENELRSSEQRWRNLTEALPQLVWTATSDGAVDYLSTQCGKYFGVPEIELYGPKWLERMHPDDRERTLLAWQAAVERQTEYEIEHRFRRFDGVYRWFTTRGVRIEDSTTNVATWFGFCTDITTGKQLAEELRQSKESAEAANRAKDEFLANVSHEIRTPMNAILGLTDLVLDTPLGEEQRQSLKTVKSAADNLLGIINDLLDFSKIEAGKLELDTGDFSLRSAVGDTLRALAVRAHRKGLELVCNVHPDVPDGLVGDPGRLRQVLLNLIGNAIKFTERGEVVVQVNVSAESVLEGDVTLRFTVRDTGIGIPPEKQSTIFRAFEQEDTSTTRKYGGTGLGLTISAQLAALMGGGISIESEPGRGSTFCFTAQFGRQVQQPATAAASTPLRLRNLRVLIVDDNDVNRHIMEKWVRSWDMEPTSAGNSLAAMDVLWHGVAVGKPHALILLDARMPDADGLTLAAKIRERTELSGARMILLTSGERPGDAGRLRELRIDDCMLKPVLQEELLETIYSVMDRTNGSGPPTDACVKSPETPPISLPPTSRRHILVAEDNDFNAQLMEALLAKRGYDVHIVSNGRDALNLADADAFDLMLLDVHMPEMDGLEVIQRIRQREQTNGGHLPVIALTARSRKEDREHCIAAGMDDFLSKPIQSADLWAAIDRVVVSERPSPSHLIDARILLAACGEDAAILKGICKRLQASLPDHLASVQAALEDKDALRLRESAHKLCGMVAAFSTVAGAIASDVEDHSARGQLQEAAALVDRLQSVGHELMQLVANDLTIESLRREAEIAEGSARLSQ